MIHAIDSCKVGNEEIQQCSSFCDRAVFFTGVDDFSVGCGCYLKAFIDVQCSLLGDFFLCVGWGLVIMAGGELGWGDFVGGKVVGRKRGAF